MLKELRIRNFALVEDAALQLGGGMSAFTGETGAGKSLLLDAISLLLGSKARSDLVRSGARSAEVEGVFDLSLDLAKREGAARQGFEVDAEEGFRLLVRREISSEDVGKNRIWIQGRSATRAQLQHLLGDWVEVSGQHEFLRLNREDFFLNLIDQYAALKEDREAFADLYRQHREVEAEIQSITLSESQRLARIDYLQFQVEELEKAGVGPHSQDEEEKLVALRARLGSVEKIRSLCENAQIQFQGLESGDTVQFGILDLVQNLLRDLRPVANLDEEFQKLVSDLEQLLESASLIQERFDRMLCSLDADPEALENAELKLSSLTRLKRKYAMEAAQLSAFLEECREELKRLEAPGTLVQALNEKRTALFKNLLARAQKLHAARLEAAARLEKIWLKDLEKLGMKKARLKINVTELEELRPSGRDRVETYFSANPGESPKPLGKVASGGELSRLLLSLKSLVAGRAEVGVYLFDEVDAGIGGETAHAVGARLRLISKNNQVLVVTHLAQVAVAAHEQFRIEKRVEKNRTLTLVEKLSVKERPQEIARMLGGTESRAAQQLAKELLGRVELDAR